MQKISSIHTLIQQIFGSHKLTGHTHFWPNPPRNQWNNFQLSSICTSMQKISSFFQFILEIRSIFESCDQTGHTHFWPSPPRKIRSTFNICEFVSKCKKSAISLIYSRDMVDKKPCNLIDWEHFCPYLRNQNFPKYGI